jgi:hypothetical protein
MLRRRRPVREIPFSFDSFLDVVANVVGIIIRLILVVWVGARSYTSIQQLRVHAGAAASPTAEAPLPQDPLERELMRERQELAEAQKLLLKQLQDLQVVHSGRENLQGQFAAVTQELQHQEQQGAVLAQHSGEEEQARRAAVLSADELRARKRHLQEELQALEKLPPAKNLLRYRTPVSRPVQAEEYMFECKEGRVTYIDLPALLGEIRQGLEDKAQLLKTQWQINDTTGPAGAFRLRYTVERERDLVGAVAPDAAPETQGSFRYGLSEWIVEPVAARRGEAWPGVLAPGSEFRQVADRLDPQQSVVTFWVYPDSFDLYRRLRDYLYERDLVVAGRPLPAGIPISCSRRGSQSRGQ